MCKQTTGSNFLKPCVLGSKCTRGIRWCWSRVYRISKTIKSHQTAWNNIITIKLGVANHPSVSLFDLPWGVLRHLRNCPFCFEGISTIALTSLNSLPRQQVRMPFDIKNPVLLYCMGTVLSEAKRFYKKISELYWSDLIRCFVALCSEFLREAGRTAWYWAATSLLVRSILPELQLLHVPRTPVGAHC